MFKGDFQVRGRNLGVYIYIYMLFKVVRLTDITMGMSIGREEVQRLSIIVFRG